MTILLGIADAGRRRRLIVDFRVVDRDEIVSNVLVALFDGSIPNGQRREKSGEEKGGRGEIGRAHV